MMIDEKHNDTEQSNIAIELELYTYLVGEYVQEASVLDALMHISDACCGALEFYLGEYK
jgi:hypothetical protein